VLRIGCIDEDLQDGQLGILIRCRLTFVVTYTGHGVPPPEAVSRGAGSRKSGPANHFRDGAHVGASEDLCRPARMRCIGENADGARRPHEASTTSTDAT